MHQAGQLGPAAQLYQKVLAQEQGERRRPAPARRAAPSARRPRPRRRADRPGRGAAAERAGVPRQSGRGLSRAGSVRAGRRLLPGGPEPVAGLSRGPVQPRPGPPRAGQEAEAVEQFRRALELRPDFATAHNNLGIALRELGQFDEALEHFRRPSSSSPTLRRPGRTSARCSWTAARRKRPCRTARKRSGCSPTWRPCTTTSATSCGRWSSSSRPGPPTWKPCGWTPTWPLAHAHLGLIMLREGQLGDALPWLKQAVELEPDNATFWEILAELYVEREEPGEAIPSGSSALALAEEDAARHAHLAGLGAAGRRPAGRGRRALRDRLGCSRTRPWPSSTWAGCTRSRASWPRPRPPSATALRLQPNFALPHARLATLLRGKLPDADLAALEQRLTDAELAEGRAPGCSSAWPTSSTPAAITPAPPTACARPTPSAGAGQGATASTSRPSTSSSSTACSTAFDAEFFARHGRVRLRLAPAGLRLRPAALGHDAGRAGAGQPLRGSTAPASCAWPGRSFEAIPARAGPHRPAHRLRAPPRRPAPSASWPSSISSACRGLDGDRADRIVDKMPDNYMYLGLLAAAVPRARPSSTAAATCATSPSPAG